MKQSIRHNAFMIVTVWCLLAAFLITGCSNSAPHASSTTTPATSTTTIPPETSEPAKAHTELNLDMMFAMLDEAEAILNQNSTLTLPANEYLILAVRCFISKKQSYGAKEVVSYTDEMVTIHNCEDAQFRDYLRFFIFLNIILDRYPDCYSYVHRRIMGEDTNWLTFYSEYMAAGYNTAQDYFAVEPYFPAMGTSIFDITFTPFISIHIATQHTDGVTYGRSVYGAILTKGDDYYQHLNGNG